MILFGSHTNDSLELNPIHFSKKKKKTSRTRRLNLLSGLVHLRVHYHEILKKWKKTIKANSTHPKY